MAKDRADLIVRVANAYLNGTAPGEGTATPLAKTAGEVHFIKDNSGDTNAWAYALRGPSKRNLTSDYEYNPRNVKVLARVMRGTMAALGHTMAAYTVFAKLKSADLSPDGALGGKGYIQNIKDMRRQYMNCIEALSALADTLHDEIRAPHWASVSRAQDSELDKLVKDTEVIREDPEGWADEEIKEEFGDDGQGGSK